MRACSSGSGIRSGGRCRRRRACATRSPPACPSFGSARPRPTSPRRHGRPGSASARHRGQVWQNEGRMSSEPQSAPEPLVEGFPPDDLRALYRALLLPRMMEEKMLLLLRQGRLSKWFSGIGQEAIAVGLTAALEDRDWVLPLHRNLGVFTGREVDLPRLLRQLLGREGGFTKGRDRTFHFGSFEDAIVAMFSHRGAMLPVACGLALAAQLRGGKRVAAVFSGDGGTSEGDFHEALNLAAVWKLRVLFVIENNQYGLSTPTSEQYACKHLADRGP